MRRTVLVTALVAVMLGGGGVAHASTDGASTDDGRVPGMCHVWSGGGWLGAPCPEGMEPYRPDGAEPVDLPERAVLKSTLSAAPAVTKASLSAAR